MKTLTIILTLGTIVILTLQIWRLFDNRRTGRVWSALAQKSAITPSRFDPSIVNDLPEPARRYFLYTIKPDTPLRSVAKITMTGELGLGSKENPKYTPMRAHQILAPPTGFVWIITVGQGVMKITGSDGLHNNRSWTRFWLNYMAPIVRVGDDVDHARSAFGRVVAEAVFWTPAALLPQNGVRWGFVDDNTARAIVAYSGMTQKVDVTMDNEGRPIRVAIPRWSNANPEQTYQVQPFGGTLSNFREFDGYMLPTHVEGGNFFGTKDYFPFYKAEVRDVQFIKKVITPTGGGEGHDN